jgi:hypothetical protein
MALNIVLSVILFMILEFCNRKKMQKMGGNEMILKILTKKEFDAKGSYKYSQFSNSSNSIKIPKQ